MTEEQPHNSSPDDEQQALLDRFLALDPASLRIRPVSEEAPDVQTPKPPAPAPAGSLGIAESDWMADPAAAEAVARALAAQGKRREAASILLKLSAQMPEKSAYFADLLDNRVRGSE